MTDLALIRAGRHGWTWPTTELPHVQLANDFGNDAVNDATNYLSGRYLPKPMTNAK